MKTVLVPEDGLDLRQTLLDIEEAYIEKALILSNHNVAEAARLLRLNRTTLVEKLRNRYPERNARRIHRNHSEDFATIDPEGEFTFRKTANGRGYDVLYKGDKLTWKRTLSEVEVYIKEKME
jgi:hypothetical protein